MFHNRPSVAIWEDVRLALDWLHKEGHSTTSERHHMTLTSSQVRSRGCLPACYSVMGQAWMSLSPIERTSLVGALSLA